MADIPPTNRPPEFEDDSVVYEFTFDAQSEDNLAGKAPRTPQQLLRSMKSRLRLFGSPLPDGYVPPPGIDIDALLRQLPPRPGT